MLLLILMLMVEGTWAVGLYHSWFFVITVMVATVLLVVTGVREIRQRRWIGAASHWGLVLVLLGGMLGAVVQTDVKMVVDTHASERVGYTDRGEAVVVPFSLQLEDFRIDYYEDGLSPKQYTSAITLAPLGWRSASDGTSKRAEGGEKGLVSVNHPFRYRGWWIYQHDYDRAQGDYVVLQLVRDPWLWLVYVGFVLMTTGAIMQTRKAWHSWKVLPIALLVAAVFAVLSLMRIELGHLPPALRSLWFFPHILIYMIAYSLMAIALILEIAIPLMAKKRPCPSWGKGLGKGLFATASALLLIGMLCGAVWAKEAWGQYWTWDAKECWAAVTWLLSVLAMHIPPRKWWNTVAIALAFGAMQVTWYGVNYLPSAPYSMHTYNK